MAQFICRRQEERQSNITEIQIVLLDPKHCRNIILSRAGLIVIVSTMPHNLEEIILSTDSCFEECS